MILAYSLEMSQSILDYNLLWVLNYEVLFLLISFSIFARPSRSIFWLRIEFVIIVLLLFRGLISRLFNYFPVNDELRIYYGYVHFLMILLLPLSCFLAIINRKIFFKNIS